MKLTPILTPLLISILLTACGGGGGNETSDTVGEPSDTDTASNHAPVISGIAETDVDEGESYRFVPVASDADGDSLTFSVSNLPDWASFDTGNGSITGRPDFDSAGEYGEIGVSVSDASATASLPPFTLTVGDVNRAPVIDGVPSSNITVGNLYNFIPTARDDDGDSLSFSVSNLPAWASFNTSNGQLSGTPGIDDIGTYSNIIIRVSDASDSASLSDFAITVADSTPVSSGNLFVDPSIGANYCSDYDAASRSCGSGDKEAYRSLSEAASVANAGDIVEIRGATFNEQLAPQNSGNASDPITFRAYNSENVVITGEALTPAVVISDRSYLIIEGLEISNVRRWMYALNAHHNIIRSNRFVGAGDSGGSSKTGIFFQEATYNKLLDNVIDDSTQDNISLIKSDYNLVVNNTVTNAAHALWVIKCGNRNVVRDNYFSNPAQKIGEIYDCDDVGFDHQFYIADATKHNVVEKNVFAKTTSYYSTSGGNGIQYSGQNGIIRFNEFYENNVGIGMQYYSPEALHNYENRIYHNTFYDNLCGGVATTDPSSANYYDNIFVNNVFYKNHECGGVKTFQLVYRNGLSGFVFDSNNLFSATAGDDVIGEWQGSGNTLAWFEANQPGFFSNNIEADPMFADETNYEFELDPLSSMIDSGRHLTTTTASGNGTLIPVADASYFYDGFGIEGELGDPVRLQGSSEVYRIQNVDYDNSRITLDRQASWTAGQGVSLDYNGLAPDMGAHESN